MGLLDDGTDTGAQDYGNLFGGAGQSFVAPFLGQQGLDAARDNSLLNMGAAMMQAGAKSFDPSHSSFLSTLGSGLQAGQQAYQGSVQRGIQSASAAQQLQVGKLNYLKQLMMIKNAQMLNPDGGASGDPTQTAAGQAATPATGASPMSPLAGVPSAIPPAGGMGGVPAGTSQAAGPGAGGAAAPAPASSVNPLNPARLPGALAANMYLTDPGKYFETQAAAYQPTDIQKTMRAAGIDEASPLGRQILQGTIAKNNYIQPTRLQGGGYVDATGYHATPSAAPAGYIAQEDPTDPSGFKYVQINGGSQAVADSSAAKASGPANYTFQNRYDPNTKQTIGMPSSIAAANAGVNVPGSSLPAPLRNNNPGALMTGPNGTIGQYPTMEEGVAAMDKNLAGYGAQGLNTVAGIVNKWNPPNGKGNTPAGTQAYINDVSQQLGIKPGDPIDMTDPTTRFHLAAAMANHENGRAPVAASGAFATPPSNPNATSAPLGTPQREQTSQAAAAASMEKDFNGLQSFRAAAPAQLQALQKMLGLAQQKTIFSTGPLGDTETATDLNPSAAEFEKQRGNYLATAGATGTDAQRATMAHAVPDYGKPKSAIIDGLQTQIGQVQAGQLRANYLTPFYNKGDATGYTSAANDFDQHITPSIASAIALPPGPARAAALKTLITKNPATKTGLNWALSNGLIQTGQQ